MISIFYRIAAFPTMTTMTITDVILHDWPT